MIKFLLKSNCSGLNNVSCPREYVFVSAFVGMMVFVLISIPVVRATEPVIFSPGETFQYDVKKLKMKVGEVKLIYEGPTQLNGMETILIRFSSTGPNFYDKEDIYLDPATYNPVEVHRDLNVFGHKEDIVESYDLNEGKVTVKKKSGNETTEQVIDKDGPLENIYGFIYRYRLNGSFQKGEPVGIRLPTKDLKMSYQGVKKLSINRQTHSAHYLVSDPPQYKIWFDSSPQRIPLKIDGTVGFGKTSMILNKYTPGR